LIGFAVFGTKQRSAEKFAVISGIMEQAPPNRPSNSVAKSPHDGEVG
jgi:hypothetical protein